MSRWEGWEREYEDRRESELNGPADVAKILEEGKIELLGAYCLGDEECSDYAWSIFADGLDKTSDPHTALLWIGKTYADLGFFADSAEALGELCSRYNDANAKRLLVEVIWWRDNNVHRIPWIPPRGDGSRYNRMMQFIDPSVPTADEEVRRVRTENQKERIAPYRPSIDPQLSKLFTVSIPEEKTPPSLVDWSFLDKDDDEDIKEVIEEMNLMHRWTRNIAPPSTPPRYDPNEPPFDPRDILGDLE